jgi:hypothetical protein
MRGKARRKERNMKAGKRKAQPELWRNKSRLYEWKTSVCGLN